MISTGDTLPSLKLIVATADGPQETTTEAFFKGRKVVVFGVPGAFTPTCSARHLPGFVDQLPAFKDKGVDQVACLAVNDPFVMKAWAKDQQITDQVTMLADGGAVFTRAIGMDQDLTARGLGVRSHRFAMVVEDGVVAHVAVEQPGEFDVSKAESVLGRI